MNGGHPSAREEVVAALVQSAREHRTITYGELAARITTSRVSPRSMHLMRLLGEACTDLDSEIGVMHAALVVRADSGIPGEGFFAWLDKAGIVVEDRAGFWQDEVEKVWSAYERNE